MAGSTQIVHRGAVPIAAAILDCISKLAVDIDRFIANAALTAAGCAQATTVAQAKTVNSLTYRSNGNFKVKAGTDNFWNFAGGTNVPTANSQKYLLLVDAAGAASFAEGTFAATAAAVILPAAPAGKTVVGIMTIVNTSGANFVPGTTSLSAAGIATTFVDGFDAALLLGFQLQG